VVSRQHQAWIKAGRPDSGLARPLAQLRDLLRTAGYTVFDWPDDGHLDAEPPEDHTQYSETGWPNGSPKWWRHAIDIMPPSRAELPSLTVLGQRIFDARQAGRITWLKYMNWPADGRLSGAVQDSWKPAHVRSASSDAGHIHLSSITGVETLDSPYNPLTEATMDLSQDNIVDIASAVVQWATRGGALPPGFRGATTNLLSIEADIATVNSQIQGVQGAVGPLAEHLQRLYDLFVSQQQAVYPTAAQIAGEIIRQLGLTPQ
jgi:hypothetical protein